MRPRLLEAARVRENWIRLAGRMGEDYQMRAKGVKKPIRTEAGPVILVFLHSLRKTEPLPCSSQSHSHNPNDTPTAAQELRVMTTSATNRWRSFQMSGIGRNTATALFRKKNITFSGSLNPSQAIGNSRAAIVEYRSRNFLNNFPY